MNLVRRIAENSFFIFTARGLEVICNLLLGILIARYLGVEDFGRYSVLMAIVWVMFPFLCLGLPQILCREIAKKKEQAADFLGTAMILNGLTILPVIVIVVLLAFFLKLGYHSITTLLIIFTFFVVRALRKNFVSVFIAFMKTQYDTISTFSICAFEILFVLGAVYFDLGFTSIFVAICVADFVGLSITLFMLWKWFVLPSIKFNKLRLKYIFKESIPLAFVDFSMLAFVYVDVFVLRIFTNDFAIGIFQSSQKVFLGFSSIPLAISVAILPHFSSLAAGGSSPERLRSSYKKVFKFLLIISLFISLQGITFSHDVIQFLFGVEFLKAGAVTRILFFAVPFLFLSTLSRVTLVALNQQKYLIVTSWLCVFVNLALDLLLVPKYGYVGAGFATLMATIVLASGNIYLLLRRLKGISLFKVISIPILVACLVGLLLYNFADLNILFLIPGSLAVYVGALFIFKALSVDEIMLLKQLLAKKPERNFKQ